MRLLEHPFRLIIAGRSHSGKTTLLLNLLMKQEYYNRYFDDVYMFCPTYDSNQWNLIKFNRGHVMRTYSEKRLLRILNENKKRQRRILIIFSDCGAQDIKKPGNYRNPLDDAQMNARHYNCSFIFEAQNLASLSTPTRQNADGVVVYETTNSVEVDELYKYYGCGDRNQFRRILRLATKENYSFLFIYRQGPKQHYFVKFHSLIKIGDG